MVNTRTVSFERIWAVDRYTRAWAIGTGLPVTLAPGNYRITGEDQIGSSVHLRLEETYRLRAVETSKA